MEKSKAGTKERSSDSLSLPNQNTLIYIFLIRWFLTATSGTKPIIVSAGHVYILLHQREK